MKRKHTASRNETFPQICDLCEFEAESKRELKFYRLSHSYVKAVYKCVDCEYVGINEESMEVHIGKEHSDKYECGLCESVFTSSESLETHLVTCETYECVHCYFTSKTISKTKAHVVKEHEDGELLHLKMARENFEEVDINTYIASEI